MDLFDEYISIKKYYKLALKNKLTLNKRKLNEEYFYIFKVVIFKNFFTSDFRLNSLDI